ncbi:MAG: TerC family protein [Bacteroidota bacterium]|nr:TerC family protein [Bacteroidota bacterium]MDP3145901.1 TerC family protein [Bacteroidota bacterium]MDP3558535.1 TerC family protein [Bacteroidota bacterium]
MFEHLLSIDGLLSLLSLTIMEVLLGIDNVIFVSIVMNRLPLEQAKKASLIWMTVGIAMRIFLLFSLVFLIKIEQELFILFNHPVQLKDIIMLAGGLFLLVNSTLEIHNKLEGANEEGDEAKQNLKKGFRSIITQILLIDIVFSVDGIVTAIGMAREVLTMSIAVIISMAIMFYYAPKISTFIEKHPTFKILALSFLVLIAVLLIVEGVHVQELHIPKGYIYFAMAFSFGVELLNLKFRKKRNPVVLRKNSIEEETK